MPSTSNGYLDNLNNNIIGPKGTLADWQHASRLYVDNDLKLAPKTKFLYHTYFQLDPVVRTVLPELKDKHNLEIGMLVKAADLPRYTAMVETRNKYNRKKNIQTSIQYEPITITFHDDNYGVTTALLEAYYRYYYADGNYGEKPGAYNKTAGDNTYKGRARNQFKYGLDNNVTVPFFQNIQISQLAKKTYTTYTIVNPIITNWQHDSLDNADGSTTMSNTITVAYEAVHYSRGAVETGANGEPTGFGSVEHYDSQPSPISLIDGGILGQNGEFGNGSDLYDFISSGSNFRSPLDVGLATFQLIQNLQSLSSEQLRKQEYGLTETDIEKLAGTDVSGLINIFIPKNNGQGGANDVTTSNPSLITQTTTINQNSEVDSSDRAIVTSSSSTENINISGAQYSNPIFGNSTISNNPKLLEDSAKNLYLKDYINRKGTNGINGVNAAWRDLPDDEKQIYRDKALELL